MNVQFAAAAILGVTLIPVRVFGCTCAAPTAPVKTMSELGAWNRADAIFEGKVESVELGWKLKETQIGDVIPNCSDRPRPGWSCAPRLVAGIALLSWCSAEGYAA